MHRRDFIKTTVLAGAAALSGGPLGVNPRVLGSPLAATRQVALAAGADRPDNIFRALRLLRKEIALAIGNRRVILKPNLVMDAPGTNDNGNLALSTTPTDCLEAILEFLKSIGKSGVIIAEASAYNTMVAFDNCGYYRLANRYRVKLVDLNQEDFDLLRVWNGNGKQSVRVAKMMLDPHNFLISATRMKTHNYVVATLSLKNMVMGAPINNATLSGGHAGSRSDKDLMHGNWGYQDINDNLYTVALRIQPHLAVLDGFEGMQGNGPCWGSAVPHRVAVAGLDWLATDRVGLELMGINPAWPAYLNYCAQAGLGQYDLSKIEVLGERVSDHTRKYQLHANVAGQLRVLAAPRT